MTTVSAAAALSGQAVTAKKTGALQELGKDVFLQLMVTQMRYQDPLSPQDNSAFVAQMAQFTALEQMQNLNASMTKLLAMQPALQNMAPAYLGLLATVAADNGTLVEGIVTAVEFAGGHPQLVINNKRYTVESIVKVTGGE